MKLCHRIWIGKFRQRLKITARPLGRIKNQILFQNDRKFDTAMKGVGSLTSRLGCAMEHPHAVCPDTPDTPRFEGQVRSSNGQHVGRTGTRSSLISARRHDGSSVLGSSSWICGVYPRFHLSMGLPFLSTLWSLGSNPPFPHVAHSGVSSPI